VVEILAAAAAFVAISAAMLVLFRGGTGTRDVDRRMDAILSRSEEGDGIEGRGLLSRRSSPFPILQAFLLRNDDWARETALQLQRAGVRLKVSEYILLRFLMGAIAVVLALLLTRGSTAGILLAVPLGIAGFWLPAMWVTLRKSRRLGALNSQLVEMLQLVSNALRSGFAFTQAVELAARQLASPMKDELEYYLRDSSLGARSEDALRAMVERTASVDLEMMVTSILVQRTTGGNLSEVLDNVAQTIRERDRLRGDIRALTASQRLSGLVLSIYPVVLGLAFVAVAPSVMKVLWEEETGRLLLAIAAALEVIGFIWIRRILALDV